MATHWWGVAFAVALAALFVNAFDLGYLPWAIAALGCAVGGAYRLGRKAGRKGKTGHWRARADQRRHEELVTGDQATHKKLTTLDAKLDAVLGLVQQLLPRAQEAVQAQDHPVGKNLIQVVNEKIVSLQGTIHLGVRMLGKGTVSFSEQSGAHINAEHRKTMIAAFNGAIPVLEKLAEHRRVTAAEEHRAVRGFEEITLIERAEIRDTIIDEVIRPSASDTEEPDPKAGGA
jgi:hypothetical protein